MKGTSARGGLRVPRLGYRHDLRQRLRLSGLARWSDVLCRSRRPRQDREAPRRISARARQPLDTGAPVGASRRHGRHLPRARSERRVRILPADTVVEYRADGSMLARSPHSLGPYPANITGKLDHWASHAPDRTFLAERDATGAWTRLTYGDALARVRPLAQALLDRGVSTSRPLLILSGNGIDHA